MGPKPVLVLQHHIKNIFQYLCLVKKSLHNAQYWQEPNVQESLIYSWLLGLKRGAARDISPAAGSLKFKRTRREGHGHCFAPYTEVWRATWKPNGALTSPFNSGGTAYVPVTNHHKHSQVRKTYLFGKRCGKGLDDFILSHVKLQLNYTCTVLC